MPVKSSARKKLSRASQRDLDTKIEFMEGLVRRDPDYVDALQLLGDHYTQRGRYAEGLKVDERLARLEPHNPLVFYNLACSYSLTEQFDRAVLRWKRRCSSATAISTGWPGIPTSASSASSRFTATSRKKSAG